MWTTKTILGLRFSAMAIFALAAIAGCGTEPLILLPDESTEPVNTTRFKLLTRFVQISDAQIVDEESPARLTVFAGLSGSAWRPQEAYSLHLLDGMVRTVNKMHVAQGPIDFLIHTGDAADNSQLNETAWFIKAMDGGTINPLTGPDDRDPRNLPDPALDPHRPFAAQGLYRGGVHGPANTIPWYAIVGNHDMFAVGVFPIVTSIYGNRRSPLPLDNRIGLFSPVMLNPVGSTAWSPITPANPGPPAELAFPEFVAANPARRFTTAREFVELHLASTGLPSGHGFDPQHPERTWYSVSPKPGLRMIGLNTSDPFLQIPEQVYTEGAISFAQVEFLRRELAAAEARGETVIVATHHPSDSIQVGNASAVSSRSFRDILRSFACVKLQIAGHWHRGAVIDRGGYVEMVTPSIIDAPQEGRVVEIWKGVEDDSVTGLAAVELRYRNFSHLDDIEPIDNAHAGMFDDPMRPIREIAVSLTPANARPRQD